ncbi:MAG TPA: ATP-binding protein [Roseiarcus sp.]|jgi:Cdc6-like AAA superfamily ATPase
MPTHHPGLRPVLTYSEPDFGYLLGKVLSPSRPLQSEEFLRGRAEQMRGIKEALYAPGRHVLIHGFRGVGKSSLAQTAAFVISLGADPIIIACDSKSTFSSIIADIFSEACNKNPAFEKHVRESGWSFSVSGLTIADKVTTQEGQAGAPSSVNEAVRQMQFLCDNYAKSPVVVVDEFDQLKDKDEQKYFEDIMSAHGSADRYFHTVALERLPWDARFEIVKAAAQALGIEIDDDANIRIARISDGFPHYVHFLSEKMFWRVYRKRDNGTVTSELFEEAMGDAASAMEMKLRGPYVKATQKYSNDYAIILWAAADGHELSRRSIDIFDSYRRIVAEKKATQLDRQHFNQRINALKQPSHGSILMGSRTGWYEFREKVIRGYVRLKAEQDGIVLEADHPAAPRRVASNNGR